MKSSLLLAFCFLLVYMVDQTQICTSSILPLGLFQDIKCNIERREPKLEGGPDLKGGGPQTPLHTMLLQFQTENHQ